MKATITKNQLIKAGACGDQVELFSQIFGSKAQVSIQACVAHANKFSWEWAAANLLAAPAWEAYHKARAPACEAYHKVCETAWEAYQEACAPAWEVYNKACATAFAIEYEKSHI